MRRLLPVLPLLFLILPGSAWGHPMPNSAVVLRLHRTTISAELTLPISELAAGWEMPLTPDPVQTVQQYGAELAAYVRAHVQPSAPDGRPWTVTVDGITPLAEAEPDVRVDLTLTPPPGAPVDRLTLHYDLIFHHLITHTAVVTLAGDWRDSGGNKEPVLLGTLRDTEPELIIDRSHGGGLAGFAAMVRLGMDHIAAGTDHLLFLLALILPAPLVAVGSRWGGYAGWRTALGRIVRVVTAFTVGHTMTLVLGVVGWVRVPGPLVESAIAFSILVSAVHALIPIFRGREVFIAGGFGLVHGLAFAATLTDLALDPLTLVASVLGFNLGIEAVQLLVVLATLPCLLRLARSRLYGLIRVGGAALTIVAALAWFAERACGLRTPVVPLVEASAAHPLGLLASLVGLTLIVSLADHERSRAHLGVESVSPGEPEPAA